MIDPKHELPIARQAELLEISRAAVYYVPRPISGADLALMRRIDALHLECPFAGSRLLRKLLRTEGHAVGRKHVATLMRRMGIEALLSEEEHEPAPPRTRGLPVPAEERPDRASQPGLGDGHHLHCDALGICVPRGGDGLGNSSHSRVPALEHADRGLLRRGAG